jgi:arabinan endo-1,5-alpha-L-arabinosidase
VDRVKKGVGRWQLLSCFLAAVLAASIAPGTRAMLETARAGAEATFTNPVYPHAAADPATFRASDGGTYVYTTQTDTDGSGENLPVLHSNNLVDWVHVGDALPQLPNWAVSGNERDTWAPHVAAFNGKFYLYFAARLKTTGKMAIGVAVADSPAGPFTPKASPLVGGDAIDPYVRKTAKGPVLFWTIPRRPIRAQHLSADGKRLVGRVHKVLRPARDREYQRLIEAPWILKHGGYFYLFYSGNHCCGTNPHYALMVARSRSLFKRYARKRGPVLESNANFIAPGHNSVVEDDAGNLWMLYHAIESSDAGYTRQLMLDRIRWRNGWPRINGGNGPSSDPQKVPQKDAL